MFKDCISLIQIKLLDNLNVKNNILFEDKNVKYFEIKNNKSSSGTSAKTEEIENSTEENINSENVSNVTA